MRRLGCTFAIVTVIACASRQEPPALAPAVTGAVGGAATVAQPSAPEGGPSATECEGSCSTGVFSQTESAALTRRIAELKALGAPCSLYADIMERSLRSGRITVRPFMWRVEGQLASGEAWRDGTIYVAREIDSLNVGRRTFEDLLWSMEHEAAHIALNLDSPFDRVPRDRADDIVRACRQNRS